jgi:hypothetical protein
MKASLLRLVFMVISTPSGLCFYWETSNSSTSRGPCHNAELKYRPLLEPGLPLLPDWRPLFLCFPKGDRNSHLWLSNGPTLFSLAPCSKYSGPVFMFWPFGFLTHCKIQVQCVSLFSQGVKVSLLPLAHLWPPINTSAFALTQGNCDWQFYISCAYLIFS